MIKVKNYMKSLQDYIRSEKAKIKEATEQGIYNNTYLENLQRESDQRIAAKIAQYRKEINEHIDFKQAKIEKKDTSSAAYQAQVANALTKLRMLGEKGLTPKLIEEIAKPIADMQDIATLAVIKNFVDRLPIKETTIKRTYLQAVPEVVNTEELMENARNAINKSFDSGDFGKDSLQSAITVSFLEKSGVFEL